MVSRQIGKDRRQTAQREGRQHLNNGGIFARVRHKKVSERFIQDHSGFHPNALVSAKAFSSIVDETQTLSGEYLFGQQFVLKQNLKRAMQLTRTIQPQIERRLVKFALPS